jgi:hypothetical protein
MNLHLPKSVDHLLNTGPGLLGEAAASGNLRVLATLLGPAYRGLLRRCAKGADGTEMAVDHSAYFDWRYAREFPEVTRLYEAAKAAQWNASRDIDWSREVDPFDPDRLLLPDSFHPASTLPLWRRMTGRERAVQRHALLAWFLSQFLHGEQGALFAAAQVTEAVPWLDAKLYGSVQVVDEGRHVEVFHAYLTRKLERIYEINDNLYVVIDALMSDGRWDVKFLGMQLMIEGLALGAFGTVRHLTADPTLKDVLKYVITDEARHVHYGVLSLERFYRSELSERERRDREDLAFELSLLLRNRFLMHEIYDEYYAHALSRAEWDRIILESDLMSFYRESMFRRIVPNLKRTGLLTDRIRPRYAALGLLAFEHEKAAPDLTAADLLGEEL